MPTAPPPVSTRPKIVSAPVRVLIVDDSATVRRVLTQELSKQPGIEVIGAAPDPYAARDMIVHENPDVLTLDIEMPRMDGLTFLDRLMARHPMPVIVVSSLGQKGSEVALDALSRGAVDFVGKPGAAYAVGDMARDLAEKIQMARWVDVKKLLAHRNAQPLPPMRSKALIRTTRQILAVGASTGGTEAISLLLRGFPASCPPTLVVQHMPAQFTTAFAKRLNELCAPDVREAKDGDALVPGQVLLAPGSFHMELRRHGALYLVKLHQGAPVFYQRPSVDVLFQSVADYAGANAVGVILTGMGQDGARGLLAMRRAGARTFAQDENSCVVFGMPKAAVELDAVDAVMPIEKMSASVLSALR